MKLSQKIVLVLLTSLAAHGAVGDELPQAEVPPGEFPSGIPQPGDSPDNFPPGFPPQGFPPPGIEAPGEQPPTDPFPADFSDPSTFPVLPGSDEPAAKSAEQLRLESVAEADKSSEARAQPCCQSYNDVQNDYKLQQQIRDLSDYLQNDQADPFAPPPHVDGESEVFDYQQWESE